MSESNQSSQTATGWLVELTGDNLGTPLFLSVSRTSARFGWTGYPEKALMVARKSDAEALAVYASARTPESTRAVPKEAKWSRDRDDLERDNERLRDRISELESILSALRRIREEAIERAERESQLSDE